MKDRNQLKNEIAVEVSTLPGLPLFFYDWWLDLVSEGKKWEYLISRNKKSEINGVLPLIYEKKMGLLLSRMPPLTPFLGPWITPFEGEKIHAKISHDQQITEKLISLIPPVSFYSQKFSPDIDNWYSFYLNGFSQTTHYTFILDEIGNLEATWNAMKNTVRTVIRNNENGLKFIEEKNAKKLYELQKLTFAKQNKSVPFSESLLSRLVNEAHNREAGKTFFVEDMNGNTHAGLFVVWDNNMAYMPVLGMDDLYKKSGGVQVLIWNTINLMAGKVNQFNFEGTMLPRVEPVFRHFGGMKKPYYVVKKDKNILLKLVRIALGR